MNKAITECDKDKVKKLIEKGHILIFSFHILRALNDENEKFAIFLMDNVSKCRRDICQKELTAKLLEKGYYKILERCFENGLGKISTHLIDVAAGKNLNIFESFLRLTTPCSKNESGHKIDKSGERKICQCVWVSSYAFTNAAKNGRKDVLLKLKEIGAPIDSDTIFIIIGKDNLKMFKVMQEYFPDRVKFSYQARWRYLNVSTFECFKYFHSLGHMPTYDIYENVMKKEPYNQILLTWLKKIRCPGTFKVYEIPEDFKDRVEDNLNPGDLPWVLKLLKTKELSAKYSAKLFNYINVTKSVSSTIEMVITSLVKSPLNECCIMIDELNLDNYGFSRLYLRLIDEKHIEKAKKIEGKIDWKSVFLFDLDNFVSYQHAFPDLVTNEISQKTVFRHDLNNWVTSDPSFHVRRMICEADYLWEKYKNFISELRDKFIRAEWKKICKGKPSKDDILDFFQNQIF